MTSRHLALTLPPATDHFPGAVNIEWRKVSSERAKLPKDKAILVSCNTNSFSGQVAMALRMATAARAGLTAVSKPLATEAIVTA